MPGCDECRQGHPNVQRSYGDECSRGALAALARATQKHDIVRFDSTKVLLWAVLLLICSKHDFDEAWKYVAAWAHQYNVRS